MTAPSLEKTAPLTVEVRTAGLAADRTVEVAAAAGLGLVTAVPLWPVTLLGYALVGAGCANIVPVLFTAAGRQAAVPAALAIPAVTTLGYAGVLAGPAAIGLLAHATSLTLAFLAVAALLLAVVAGAGRLRL